MMTMSLRDRLLPMLQLTAAEYHDRTPAGYPEITDDRAGGIVGIALDPSYTLFFVEESGDWSVTMTRRNPRTDARSSASSMRHGGAPLHDSRVVAADISDQSLRNLIAELKMHFNQQPGIIHVSDS